MTKEQLLKEFAKLNSRGEPDPKTEAARLKKLAEIKQQLSDQHGMDEKSFEAALMDDVAPAQKEDTKPKATVPTAGPKVTDEDIEGAFGPKRQGDIVEAASKLPRVNAEPKAEPKAEPEAKPEPGGRQRPKVDRGIGDRAVAPILKQAEEAVPVVAGAPAAKAAPVQAAPANQKIKYSKQQAAIDRAIIEGRWKPGMIFSQSKNEPASEDEIHPQARARAGDMIDTSWGKPASGLTAPDEWKGLFEPRNAEGRIVKTVAATGENDAGLPSVKFERGIYQRRMDNINADGTVESSKFVQIPKPADVALEEFFGPKWNGAEDEPGGAVTQRRAEMLRNFTSATAWNAPQAEGVPANDALYQTVAKPTVLTGQAGQSVTAPAGAKTVVGQYGVGFATNPLPSASPVPSFNPDFVRQMPKLPGIALNGTT